MYLVNVTDFSPRVQMVFSHQKANNDFPILSVFVGKITENYNFFTSNTGTSDWRYLRVLGVIAINSNDYS